MSSTSPRVSKAHDLLEEAIDEDYDLVEKIEYDEFMENIYRARMLLEDEIDE